MERCSEDRNIRRPSLRENSAHYESHLEQVVAKVEELRGEGHRSEATTELEGFAGDGEERQGKRQDLECCDFIDERDGDELNERIWKTFGEATDVEEHEGGDSACDGSI